MTREEAIKELQEAHDTMRSYDIDSIESRLMTALNMAIKALQEPSGDFISKQVVLEMAYDISEIDGEHFTEPCMVVDVEDIKNLPPVNPQEKTGHWIYDEYESNWNDTIYHCSCCKRTVIVPYESSKKDLYNDYPYCHCGAKMVEPQEVRDEE